MSPSSLVLARRKVYAREECAEIVRRVYAARDAWTSDWDGEQFSLGRAFYTHLEQEKARSYFADAAANDARVEAHVPGLQAKLRGVVAAIAEGHAYARRGWCGAGVHVFPAGGHTAREGGVIHFDTEGLAATHITRRKRALTVVVMLQRPEEGGGLLLWDLLYEGREGVEPNVLASARRERVEYEEGEAIAIDSYRLHQIEPFAGARDRVSATLHAAEVDAGRWETWF